MRIYIVCACMFVYSLVGAQELQLETAVQTGHYETITAVKYSPDGKHLFSASEDLTIKLWEISTGREIRTFMGPEQAVRQMDVSKDGRRLITISGDGPAWIWDVMTGQELAKLQDTADFVTNAIYASKGDYIITSGKESSAAIWDSQSLTLLQRLEGPSPCQYRPCQVSLAVDKDDKTLVLGIQDRTVARWDLKSGEILSTTKTRFGSCSSCFAYGDISNDGKLLLTSGRDSVRVWKLPGAEPIAFATELKEVKQARFSQGGRYVVARDRFLHLIDYPSGKTLWTYGVYPDEFETFDISPDGRFIAVAGNTKEISILAISGGTRQQTLSGFVSQQKDSLRGTVRYWVENLFRQDVSPDGRLVAEPRNNRALVWELHSGRVVKKFGDGSYTIVSVVFSPDGKSLATAGGDRVIRLWDINTGQLLRALRGHSGTVLSLAFSRDSRYLVSGGWDSRVVAWDLESGTIMGRYNMHDQGSPIAVSFMPGNLYLITGGLDEKLKMTDIDTGEPVRDLIGHRTHVVSLDYSPDGKYLLTGSWDRNAKLWDLSTGLQVQRFAGHGGSIYDVDYSSNGKWIATCSWDKTARVWDIESGEVVFQFSGARGAITSVNFTPDNKHLITSSRDGRTIVWSLETGVELYTHVITIDSEWLVKSPAGYFYATDKARNSIYFVRGLESYNIEQFFDEFYNPGLVEDILSESPKLNRNRLLDQLQESPPPGIEIISPESRLISTDPRVRILCKVSNEGGGIAEVRVQNNGKAITSVSDFDEKLQKTGKSQFLNFEAELVPGLNVIEISGFSDARIESKKQKLEVTFDGPEAKPVCYVLSIGINQYMNPILNLNYAKTDASSFSSLFRQKGKKIFEKVEITTLSDNNATRENIINEIAQIAKEARPQDVFFMFYAGHGSIVDETFYFIPTEVVRLYDAEKLKMAAISDVQMQTMLQQVRALKQMIVLDACHSGASTEVLALRGSSEEKALAQLSRTTGVHVLAAAGSEQTAAEFESLGHGLFTYLLLEALTGKADGAPNDGKVTVYELRSYIDSLVPEYSLKYKGTPQYPNTFSRGNDFPLIIY